MNRAVAFFMAYLFTFAARFESRGERRDERGATAVEYGLVVGLISVVVLGAVALLGPAL